MAKGITGKVTNTFVWIILILAIVGLGGWGARNFGNSVQSVGHVGDAQIPVSRYQRALRAEVNSLSKQLGQNLTMAQAQQFNVQGRVVQRLIGEAALAHEAGRIGISVGDAEIARQIRATNSFAGADGKFDQDTYNFTLQQVGLTARTYESELRGDVTSTILKAGVTAGMEMPDAYRDTLVGYLGETRSFSWIQLDEAALPQPVAEPSESDLQDYYDAHGDAFMLPETRQITYAWLSPEMMADKLTVDAADIRALYESRSADYNIPERRLVERLVFADDAAATEAMTAIARGDTTFQKLVEDRGLTLDDVALGDVTRDDLGLAADIVFGLTEPGLAGPAPTSLGPAIFRVNAILEPRVTPFEDVEQELRAEYTSDAARRAISDQITAFDDLLAGGATLEDLAKETDMELGQIDWTNGSDEGIAAYEAFGAAAASVNTDDYPTITELDDGGVFALRLDNDIPARPEPFEDARETVAEAWHGAEVRRQLLEQAATLKAQLDNGAPLSSLGYPTSVETRLRRDTFIEGAPRELIGDVFALTQGKAAVAENDSGVYVAQLSDIQPADRNDPDLVQLADSITQHAAQSLAGDVLTAYTNSIEAEAGIAIDQNALRQADAGFN